MFQKIVPVFPVHNIHKTISFYRDKLGFDTTHYGSYMVARKHQIEIQFYEFTGKAVLPMQECNIYIDNIEDLYAQFSAQEIIQPEGKMNLMSVPVKMFTIKDNNGHQILFKGI